MNRHQTWLALGRAFWLTGDERYRDAFVGYLNAWMAGNPPLTGVNWASMLELSLRAISWLWALHFFAVEPRRLHRRATAPWTVDLLLGLDCQLRLVEQNALSGIKPSHN